MRRREFITILSGVSAWPLTALQPALLTAAPSLSANDKSPARIGWLKIQDVRHTPGQLQAFREGMRARGLVESRDYVLEERYADGDEIPAAPSRGRASSAPALVSLWQQVSPRLPQPRA